MKKSRKPDTDRPSLAADTDLWTQVTRDVRRLPGRRAEAPPPAAPEPPEKAARPPSRPRPMPVTTPARRLPELAPGKAPGLDGRSATRLKRGELAIEARLDLHGMTQERAHSALARFIATAQADGRRCVLVITGKGSRSEPGGAPGVLRAAVPKWLNGAALRPSVLAFAPAKARDGGDGALYVLLKRARPRP